MDVKWKCVLGGRSERGAVCVFVCVNVSKDRPVVELFLWRSLFNFPSAPLLFFFSNVLLSKLIGAPLIKATLNQIIMISVTFCESYHVAKCLYLFEGPPIPRTSSPHFVRERRCVRLDAPSCARYCISLS